MGGSRGKFVPAVGRLESGARKFKLEPSKTNLDSLCQIKTSLGQDDIYKKRHKFFTNIQFDKPGTDKTFEYLRPLLGEPSFSRFKIFDFFYNQKIYFKLFTNLEVFDYLAAVCRHWQLLHRRRPFNKKENFGMASFILFLHPLIHHMVGLVQHGAKKFCGKELFFFFP